MKRTYKNNRKYKKKTNKRRRKSIKKMKGGDKYKIIVYPSEILKKDSAPVLLYDLKREREFPKTISDSIIFQPYRDIEESLYRLNLGMNSDKNYFEAYPLIEDSGVKKYDITEFEVNYPPI